MIRSFKKWWNQCDMVFLNGNIARLFPNQEKMHDYILHIIGIIAGILIGYFIL